MAEILTYCTRDDVDAYTAQGWSCWPVAGFHFHRLGGRTFICVLVLP